MYLSCGRLGELLGLLLVEHELPSPCLTFLAILLLLGRPLLDGGEKVLLLLLLLLARRVCQRSGRSQ